MLVDVADKAAVAAHNAPIVAALGDGAVRAGGAGGNGLPDDLAAIAKTELAGAVADDSAVCGASALATGCWGRSRCGT